MPVDRLLVQSLAIAQVVGADSYTSTPAANSPLFTNGLRDLILAVDGSIIAAGLSNGNWGHRFDFETSVAVAHGGSIPTHIGPLGPVRIAGKAAVPWPPEDIERERANALGVPLQPHFALVGTRLYHNATAPNFGVTTADLDYYNYTMDTSGFLCKAPVEMTEAEVAAACAYIINIEGDDPASANLYGQMYAAYLKMISEGAMTLPSLSSMQQQAA